MGLPHDALVAVSEHLRGALEDVEAEWLYMHGAGSARTEGKGGLGAGLVSLREGFCCPPLHRSGRRPLR